MPITDLLDLVDDQGGPTQAMIALREASNLEFPARLAEVVTAAYAEVFRYKDPAKDSPESLQEIFRFYRPPSMQPRMLRLFYGLCERAGLIKDVPVIGGHRAPRRPPASARPLANGYTSTRRNSRPTRSRRLCSRLS